MGNIKHLKPWIMGVVLILLIGISYGIVAQESADENLIVNSKEYKNYVKKAKQVMADLQKIDLAVSSKTKLKPVYNDLLKIGNDLPEKYIDDNNLVSGYLLQESIKNYKELLRGCLKGGKIKDSSLLKYLQSVSKSGVRATQIAIEKSEIMTVADCPVSHVKGTVSISCFSCAGKGKCTFCSGKGCKICDKTQMCIACLNAGRIICPICTTIIFSRSADLENALDSEVEDSPEDTEEIEEPEEEE